MRRLVLPFLLFIFVCFPLVGHAAYASNICSGTVCSEGEVGPFMQNISKDCGNLGSCSLDDLLTVFVNIGNFVVGIIGGVVLLMYVVGGFYWLASAGRKEWVDTGKKYMTISTAGLLIVMFSYLIIYAIKGALVLGTVSVDENYYACTGSATLGKACDLNSTCTEYGCESQCLQTYGLASTTEAEGDSIFTILSYYDCVDTSSSDNATSGDEANMWYDPSSCTTNLCPGGAANVCCKKHLRY